MTPTKPLGGFAFPSPGYEDEVRAVFHEPVYGMSLRDYLAAHSPIVGNDVVQSLGSYPDMKDDVERTQFMDRWAELRYEYADAMLAQRSEGS